MDTLDILLLIGLPTTLTSAVVGFIVWFFKRKIDKNNKAQEEHNKNVEKLMVAMFQTSKANNILSVATAKAVQRIPDAHCNGDMTAALEEAEKMIKEEKDFLFDQGIKHILENV